MKLYKTIFGVILALGLHSSLWAEALKISVTQGKVEPLRIAVIDMRGDDAYLKQLGKEIASIVENDLQGSGLFRALSKGSFIQKSIPLNSKPKFPEWRILSAQGLLYGRLTRVDGSKFRAEIVLYDVNSERLMGRIAFTHSKVRRIAHKISDYVFNRLTGEKGYFDTQIVYVTEEKKGRNTVKKLVLMDQDGKNTRKISYGQSLVMTPRFAPNSRKIAYLDFGKANRDPKVYILDPDQNKRMLVGRFPGMTFAPRFSPSGDVLVMSLACNGSSCLYSFNLKSGQKRRLTHGNSIDTSPSYSPDGKKLVFNSDRGGRPQIYKMDSTGGNIKRISFGEGSYRTPVWSPRGDLIAFIKIWKGSFYLGVMRPDGSGERLITQGYLLDDPIWSANGRMIMYSRQSRGRIRGKSGKSKLNLVDLTGANNREIPTLPVAYSGAWSPQLF